MAEYLEREALLHEMKMDIRPPFAVVRDFPPADVAPVVHGKWLDFYKDFSTAECCKCGELFEVSSGREAKKAFFELFKGFYKYCPNCGAKMDLEDENEPA